ncbi:hypothetical protein [Pseudomonas taiwanensis]|uniref:hypothetical protein n=1 Tax=Pseudomonas taiwanensis TaxID=470150 RepID=UPI00041BDAEA|nr:hypothetical protein [Pseudomonas taiwanensis]
MLKKLEWWWPVITLAYFSVMMWWVIQKWDEFSSLKLNELGDFLAGAFGPLAFLWLLLGIVLQGRELKASSEALKKQGEELAENVRQQKALVDVAERQWQAQLESHENQAKQFQLLVEPIFQLYSTTGGFSNGERYRDFSLTNMGVDCQRIEVFFRPESVEDKQLVFKQAVLKVGQLAQFSLSFPNDVIPGKGMILVRYVNRVGGMGAQSFKCLFELSDDGGIEVKIEKFFV